MIVYVLPLVAVIAYIPLFAVLLSSRPWNRQHKLFLLFLAAAASWSLSAFLGVFLGVRGLPSGQTLGLNWVEVVVRVALCIYILMLTQLHYLIRSFYSSDRIRVPVAYVFPIVAIILSALGHIPRGVHEIIADGIRVGIGVSYGVPLIVMSLLFLATVGARDIRSLVRKYRLSPDPTERNQIAYLLAAIAVLTVFLVGSASERGGEYPVGHMGNLIVAGILTYAVVTYRLLDIRVVLRQAIINGIIYSSGLGIVLLLFSLAHQFVPGFELDYASLAITIGLGIPAILFFGHKMRRFWQEKVEGVFTGTRSFYRRQLSGFCDGIIGDIPTLKDLGKEFVSLLAKSIGCRRACLLLPQAADGSFATEFCYPPTDDNSMRDLKLRQDSPIVTWLKRECTTLSERKLAIFPEFRSIWEEEREDIRSAGVKLFTPLMDKKKLIAVLAVGEKWDGKLYAVEDIDLLELVTARVAASMAREHAREQMRERDEERELMSRSTAIITSNMSIHMIFEHFVGELQKVAVIDWAAIAIVDGTEIMVAALASAIGCPWQRGEKIPLAGTATEWVCREKRSVYEADLKRHRRFRTGEQHLEQGIRSIIYLPLSVSDRNIGSLILASRKANAFGRRQIALLEKVALQIAAPVENAQLYARMEQMSRTDVLTGLFNRRHLEERLGEEISRHSRYGDALSLFMIDMDNFKSYNDRYGHPAGDVLFAEIGRAIRNSIRDVDQAFRYGGDEFIVMLPQTARNDACVVAERVRRQIVDAMEEKATGVTCSIGVASYPADGVSANELVGVADAAQYLAKRAGGNRILASSDSSSKMPENAGVNGRRSGLSTVYALVSAAEATDTYTHGHSRKVNTYAVALAEAIGLSPDEVSRVGTAALLHDIGKIGIPDKMLDKKGKLTEEEWGVIKTHPGLGANIVANIPNLVPCVGSILHHHERWDGRGYPDGMKGEEIPVEARILAIADAFEAMTSARPYRAALSLEEVVRELRQGAGTQFDPGLVNVFIGIVDAGLPERVMIGQDSASRQAGS